MNIFPTVIEYDKHGQDTTATITSDFTLRDAFALAIVQGLAAHHGITERYNLEAEHIWELASALADAR